MLCPKCKKGKLMVVNHYPELSKKTNTIRRYRKCDQCGHRVRTMEAIADEGKPKQEQEN